MDQGDENDAWGYEARQEDKPFPGHHTFPIHGDRNMVRSDRERHF